MSISRRRTAVIGFTLAVALSLPTAAQTDTQSSGDQLQIEELRAAVTDPGSIEDKVFILSEYSGALRERELAKVVLARSRDPQVLELAKMVRDGHQLGMDRMAIVAKEMHFRVPAAPTSVDEAMILTLSKLPARDLERWFLAHQRAMHAWDITVFQDYASRASNRALAAYVRDTIAPLRKHAEQVVALSNAKGIPGGLAVVAQGPTRATPSSR